MLVAVAHLLFLMLALAALEVGQMGFQQHQGWS
jgi:hypothetical protein